MLDSWIVDQKTCEKYLEGINMPFWKYGSPMNPHILLVGLGLLDGMLVCHDFFKGQGVKKNGEK